MKALVLEGYHRLTYKEVPDPEIGPEDVLIRVKACGICGSDVHGMDGSTGRRIPPIIMGHEASGVIAATGEQVTDYRIGERVTFDSTVYCGRCFHCRRAAVPQVALAVENRTTHTAPAGPRKSCRHRP